VAIGEEVGGSSRTSRAILVAVSAEVVWQITSKALSSPQTAELDAEARAPTIWKWVKIAGWESAGWIFFLSVLDGSLWPAFGGLLAGVTTYAQYKYAITSGLNGKSRPGGGYGGQH
jgi:hypothetical protein